MTDLTRRQKEVLENKSRKQIYTYLQDGVEAATAGEVASEFDLKRSLAIYDLRVLVDAGLVERVPAEKAGQDDGFKAVEQ